MLLLDASDGQNGLHTHLFFKNMPQRKDFCDLMQVF